MLCITANGRKLKPYKVLKRKILPELNINLLFLLASTCSLKHLKYSIQYVIFSQSFLYISGNFNSLSYIGASKTTLFSLTYYVGYCHHGMTCPWVADGGDSLQILKMDVNILKSSCRQLTRGGRRAWGGGGWARG
jgi:hypothetical protein